MSKAFNAAVRSQFAAAIASAALKFVSAKVPSAHAWPGERAFVWSPREGVKCWISLITSHKGYNEFFVEVGWSTLDRYPQLNSRPTLARMETATRVLEHAELMCRLSSLGETPDTWKYRPKNISESPEAEQFMLEVGAALAELSAEEAEVAARPLITEAIADVVRLGVPFLERSAAQLVGQPNLPAAGPLLQS